ncbi:hypothetical protein PSTT_12047 [Puccinia striiformis]|uniref:Uncharacterized protein n=1 Tax=Puccinia striiformis TaxID=27350 RepID=A0A2S4UXT6_9BASI|nr:hypothetical protein PSTT_12047 [Puccinia striiformis]
MDSTHQDLKSENLFDVKDLVVVITGGGTGIGQMMLRALIANGVKKAYIADLSKKDQIEELRKTGKGGNLYRYPPIGGPPFDGSLKTAEEISSGMWGASEQEAEELLSTNVLGYYYVSAALIPLLSKSKNQPQIINISSNASFSRQAMLGILYSLSKAAITHLTKILATQLSNTNIRVNAIAPGLFPSELTAGDSNSKNQSQLDDTMGLNIPKGRPGIDKEIASTVLYLASKHQQYTSGSIVLIDGGVLNQMPSTY